LIRLGTRGSALALAQAEHVAGILDDEVELVTITTSGDRGQGAPAPGRATGPGGDKARFVKEIEEALLAGEVDLAVHSAKDVPSELPDGLSIVGVPGRVDARDALCGAAALAELPEGAVVGTGSLRRRAQLLALRPDLDVRPLRGNVDTRLSKLSEGDYHALVLALAGLERLGRGGEGVPLDQLVPAPGQGCLALEARSDDERLAVVAAAVSDREALVCLTAERAVVQALDASCNTPLGAHATLSGDQLRLEVFVGLPDGSAWVRDSLAGEAGAPADLGGEVAGRVAAAGGAELLRQAEAAAAGA
jgi:hydroxymethylbilane synthase